MSTNQLGQIYIKTIVKLHGLPKTIVSDQNTKFVSVLWQSMQRSLGIRLEFNITYHPQTDGQFERVNQVVEDMLKAYCLDRGTRQINMLSLVEFTYNNSYKSIVKMVSYKALYGRRCRSPLHQDEIGERDALTQSLGPKMTQKISS